MAKSSSFFTFLAGLAAGASIVYLARTEKGEHIVSKVEKAGGKILDAGCSALVTGLNALENCFETDEEFEQYVKEKKAEREAAEE